MIKEAINNKTGLPVENHIKLSIQVSLNGLSFCILDSNDNSLRSSEKLIFAKQLTPYIILKKLKELFEKHNITKGRYSEIVVVHRNNLFGLVPMVLFDDEELPNYLKFNTKILANDHMAYDELDLNDLVNVYVPFVNINNYVYDLFGAFTFKHHGTVLIESLLQNYNQLSQQSSSGKNEVCYIYVYERQMDITIIAQKKLLLFNNFSFVTKEDFLYYLLFTLEQLKLDTGSIIVKLFGDIEEDDDIFQLCLQYINNITIFAPTQMQHPLENRDEYSIDFTTLNAF
ncbi:hypothetical protein LCGC14_1283900 [marine sediment metagenome]|uniref:DUF3822 family protein n=2 Tax=root TaxID=1 RepID=A0A831QW01_9FLAO|nr:DUF3822 family protein [Pricia antarctica]